jgi:hypothetical protein
MILADLCGGGRAGLKPSSFLYKLSTWYLARRRRGKLRMREQGARRNLAVVTRAQGVAVLTVLAILVLVFPV